MAIDVLPPSSPLTAFLAASVVLAVTPGPGVVYIVSRSVADGRRHGLASVVGVAFGNLGNALAASAGLAGVLAVSTAAFTIVKYAGSRGRRSDASESREGRNHQNSPSEHRCHHAA